MIYTHSFGLPLHYESFSKSMWIDRLRPRWNEQHFADDIFKCIFLNENVWIPINISMKFVPKGPINNISALVQIMAWRRPGDKPLSEPIMVSLTTHICVTRPQWVKTNFKHGFWSLGRKADSESEAVLKWLFHRLRLWKKESTNVPAKGKALLETRQNTNTKWGEI